MVGLRAEDKSERRALAEAPRPPKPGAEAGWLGPRQTAEEVPGPGSALMAPVLVLTGGRPLGRGQGTGHPRVCLGHLEGESRVGLSEALVGQSGHLWGGTGEGHRAVGISEGFTVGRGCLLGVGARLPKGT